MVEGNGEARLLAPVGTYGWLVEPAGLPQRAKLGQSLQYASVKITGIGPESRFDLNARRVTNPAFLGTAKVENGKLSGVPVPPIERPDLKKP